MNVTELLHRQAAIRPDSVAIIDMHCGHDRALTFAQLDRAAGAVARLLRNYNLQAGHRVLVLQPMSSELYVVLAAILRIGLVAIVPDVAGRIASIERCCAVQSPHALIASSKAHLPRFVSPALRRIPIKFSIGLTLPGAISLSHAFDLSHDEPIHGCAPDDPALITFTSGSTAEPKAALRSHGFLLAQHRAIEHALELKPSEVDLNTLPIFVLANLASGVTSLLPGVDLRRPDAIDAAAIIRQIESNGATRCGTSPAVCQRLADYCEDQGRTLPTVRQIFSGCGPVTPALMDRLQRIAPRASITAVYGSTEAEPIARISRHEISATDSSAMLGGRGLLAGQPVPTIQLRIVKDRCGVPIGPYTQTQFDAISLAPGEPGEIVVAGPHVLPGYANGHSDRDNKFDVNGMRWHRTGDAGYLDQEGRLWLLGRCSARIEDGHGTLYPFSVDYVAAQHPGIRRAAVVAHRDKRLLAVELSAGVKGSFDRASLLQSVAFAEVHELRVLNRLPVDARHNSKVDYSALRALLEKQRER